jgi:adenylate cyclase class IV
MGAIKVFDADRIFTTLDFEDRRLLQKGSELRLTEEEKLKLSYDGLDIESNKESVKVFVSRKEETLDLLSRLGLSPISTVKSHRVLSSGVGLILILTLFRRFLPFLKLIFPELISVLRI